jgi:hypothetical protein
MLSLTSFVLTESPASVMTFRLAVGRNVIGNMCQILERLWCVSKKKKKRGHETVREYFQSNASNVKHKNIEFDRFRLGGGGRADYKGFL